MESEETTEVERQQLQSQGITELTSNLASSAAVTVAAAPNETAEQEEVSKQQMKKFNQSIFKFKKTSNGLNIQQEQFKKAFYQKKQANKDKINQQLVELTYLQVLNRLKKEKKDDNGQPTKFPKEFHQNEMKWAAQLMRSKRLQKIMAGYTEEIARVLDDELQSAEGKKLVSEWVSYPHKYRKSVSPPARNTIMLEQLEHAVWMPEKAIPIAKFKDGGVKSVYNKHRKHLDELSLKNKKKQEVLIELEAKAKDKEFAQEKITEQVLNKMAVERLKKGKKSKHDKKAMTPFQEALHEKLQSAQERINSIQTLDEEFQEHLLEIEEDLTLSNQQKQGRNPGGQILHMMTKWSQQEVHTDEELKNYAGELWLTAQEFEKELRETEFALELENKQLKMQYRTRADGIRAMTSMRIEALESALIETKLQMARERERAEMQLAEMESRVFNNYEIANSEMDQRVKMVEQTLDDPKFQDISDEKKISLLQRMTRRLQLCIRGMQNEKTQFKKQINELNFKIEKNEEFNVKTQNSVKDANEKVLYYQLTLYDMLLQTGILDNIGPDSMLSEEKCLALQEIIDLNKERIRLDEEQDRTFIEPDEAKKIARLETFVNDFDEVLREVDFRSIFYNYQRVVQARARSVEIVSKELKKIGMLKDPEALLKAAAAAALSKAKQSQRMDDTMMTVSNLLTQQQNQDQQENNNDEYEHKIYKIDGVSLKNIQMNFDMLSKPLNKGMIDFILEQEKMEAEQIDTSDEVDSEEEMSISDDDDDGDGSRRTASKLGGGGDSKRSSRRASIASSNQQVQNLGIDLGKMERKDKLKDKEAKSAFRAKLQQKQAQRQEEETKRVSKGGSKTKVQGKSQLTIGGQSDRTTKTISPPGGKNNKQQSQQQKGSKNSDQQQQQSLIKLKKTKYQQNDDDDVNERVDDGTDGGDYASPHGSEGPGPAPSRKTGGNKDTKKAKQQQNQKGDNRRESQQPRVGEPQQQRDRSTNKAAQKTSTKQKGAGASQQKQSQQIVSLSKNKNQKVSMDGASDRQDYNDNVYGDRDGEGGFHSDGNHTEPLDRTRDVLDELENKILMKYAQEIQEADAEPANTYKLKSKQNKELSHVFEESLGQRLKDRDDTMLQMTGNLPEFIDQLNGLQEQYLRVPPEKPVKKTKKKKKKKMDDSDDEDDQVAAENEIPLVDCIVTELGDDGELKGFRIRPELSKVIMSQQEERNDGRDMTQIIKIIRSVNFLNRIVFKPDFYLLGTQKGGMKSLVARSRNPVASDETLETDQNKQNADDGNDQSEPSPSHISEAEDDEDDVQDLPGKILQILKGHAAAIYAQGNQRVQRYQLNMQKNCSLEEIMQYVIPNIVKKSTTSQQKTETTNVQEEDQRVPTSPDEQKTSNITFLKYLQILLQNIETKMQKIIMPKLQSGTSLQNKLSIQELVFYGTGGASADTALAADGNNNNDGGDQKKHGQLTSSADNNSSQSLQQDQSNQTEFKQGVVSSSHGSKDAKQQLTILQQQQQNMMMLNSPFPTISLSTKKKLEKSGVGGSSSTTVDQASQTDDSLFADYLREREARDTSVQLKMVNNHIDQALADEMTKTIGTLSEFVDKVQQQSELFLQAEKENQLKRDSSKRSHNLASSPSTLGRQSPTDMSPLNQLKSLKAKLDMGNDILQGKINEQRIAIERQKAQRKAEFDQRRKEQEAKARELKTKDLTLVQKFPRLGAVASQNNAHHVQSERSYSMVANANTYTAEVSKMPLLHNSTTKASTLVQQPFKQTHMDRNTFNQDSTQSKFSIKRKKRSSVCRPGSVGRNPPGLVAKRLDYPSQTPEIVTKHDPTFIVNGSLESKDFGRYDATATSANSQNHRPAANSVPRASDIRAARNTSQVNSSKNASKTVYHPVSSLLTNNNYIEQRGRGGFLSPTAAGRENIGFSSDFGTQQYSSSRGQVGGMTSLMTNQLLRQQNLQNHQQNQMMQIQQNQHHHYRQAISSGYTPQDTMSSNRNMPASPTNLSTPKSMSLYGGGNATATTTTPTAIRAPSTRETINHHANNQHHYPTTPTVMQQQTASNNNNNIHNTSTAMSSTATRQQHNIFVEPLMMSNGAGGLLNQYGSNGGSGALNDGQEQLFASTRKTSTTMMLMPKTTTTANLSGVGRNNNSSCLYYEKKDD